MIIHPRIRLDVQTLVFYSLVLLASCNDDILEERDPCDFVRSTDEVSLDTSTACQDCFLKFSFKGRLYDFRDNRIKSFYQCNGEKCTETNVNEFFEIKFNSMQRSSHLFAALKEERALLTPDSLMLTDFNFFQASFLLKDRCGEEYQVAKNANLFSPDVSSSTLTGIKVYNYFVIDDTRYSTSYLISGTFSTQLLIDDVVVSIGGSYALLYNITEPF